MQVQRCCCLIFSLLCVCVYVGCEDALLHLLNYVWPNVFEESAHVIAAVMEAIEAMMIAGDVCRYMYICMYVCM